MVDNVHMSATRVERRLVNIHVMRFHTSIYRAHTGVAQASKAGF